VRSSSLYSQDVRDNICVSFLMPCRDCEHTIQRVVVRKF